MLSEWRLALTMDDFRETLGRLGLLQYIDGFVGEAFDSWEVLTDITEKDLEKLGVKLGHRRVLQRAIAEYRKDGMHSMAVVDHTIDDKDKTERVNGYTTNGNKHTGAISTSRATTTGKRKYRRHPKPDDNAPDRPPSAYVLFSNDVRENLKAHDLSFTEIAKAVGERWQALPPDEKAVYESKSQAMKDTFYAQLAEYKKTPAYADYQRYLVEFKAKHESQSGDSKRRKDDKRPMIDRSNSDERQVSSPENRASSTHSSERYFGERRSPPSVTSSGWRPPTRVSTHTSPETYKFHLNASASPSFSPHHTASKFASINAPVLQSPIQHNPHRPGDRELSPRNDHPMAVSTSLAYGFTRVSPSNHASTSPPDFASMRAAASVEPSTLPPMVHRDSPQSSGSPYCSTQPALSATHQVTLPNRQLPPPFPIRAPGGHVGLPHLLTSLTTDHIPQHSSGLATLLRAGEHLASHDVRSPPARDERGAYTSQDSFRESKPP